MSEQAESCHVCGAEADASFNGQAWCAGCLHVQGSCCADDDDDGKIGPV